MTRPLLLIIVAMIFTGCFSVDRTECGKGNVRIDFVLRQDDGTLRSMRVDIFDDNDNLLRVETIDRDRLACCGGLRTNLAPGRYRLTLSADFETRGPAHGISNIEVTVPDDGSTVRITLLLTLPTWDSDDVLIILL